MVEPCYSKNKKKEKKKEKKKDEKRVLNRYSLFMDWQPISSNPTDDAIEAIIQQATSNAPLRSPLRDTRTQLFVGNVLFRFFSSF